MQNLPSGTPRPTGTVTFLFTDIQGSTRRWGENPQAMQLAFARQEDILRHAIEANGGYAYKTIGDAFQAAFPTAFQALQAAIDAQRALHSESWPPETGEVRVRMALHTGVTEERGDDYVGPVLNRVARLLSTGHGAQTLLSEVTHQLVQDALPQGVQLLDMGEHRLRDLTRSEHIFQLVVPDLPSVFPPLRTLDYRPNNLPLQPTPFVGRERELAEVAKLLAHEEVRLLTLTGPGGIGKTRVGLQVATEVLDSFPDGVWFVELAALADASLVASTIAQGLGVREAPGAAVGAGPGAGASASASASAGASAGKPIIDTLKAYLREKQLLLVLDNVEQVMDASGAVAELLEAAPNLKVLITSREKLNIYREQEYEVPPLSLPDITHLQHLPSLPTREVTENEAVQLFIERARAAKADFELNNDNALAVAEICVRLDGLPLAIELAAARVKMLPPQALLARLSSNLSSALKLLTGGSRDLSSRQQTLRGTIDWSYNLLSSWEKQFFWRIAVFQGGCTLEALEEVCNSEGLQVDGTLPFDVLNGVQSLVDKSLLRKREGRKSDIGLRFWLLETIHEYAREKLQESGEVDVVREEHALYVMRLAEEAEPHLTGKDQQEWLDRLEEEHDNIRAALRWAREVASEEGNRERQKGAAAQSKTQSTTQSNTQLKTVIEAAEALQVGLRIGGAVARLWQVHGYYSEGREQLSRLLGLEKALQQVRAQEAQTWSGSMGPGVDVNIDGQSQFTQGVYRSDASDEAKTEYKARERVRARALHWAGVLALLQGDYPSARSMSEESVAMLKELEDKASMAYSLNSLGNVAFEQGDYSLAGSLFEESLAVRREVEDKTSMAYSLNNLGLVAKEQGDYSLARSLLEEGLALSREQEDRRGKGYLLGNLGLVAQEQGDYPSARSLFEESLGLFRELGDKWGIALSLAGLGGGSVRGVGNPGSVTDPGNAGGTRAIGELRRGTKLLGAVQALLESIGAVLAAEDRRPYERAVEQARSQLSEEEFEKAWQEGRAMSMEEAIEYALEDNL